jgi:hypothetical protein
MTRQDPQALVNDSCFADTGNEAKALVPPSYVVELDEK